MAGSGISLRDSHSSTAFIHEETAELDLYHAKECSYLMDKPYNVDESAWLLFSSCNS